MPRLFTLSCLAVLLGHPSLSAQTADSMPPGHQHTPGMTHPADDSSFAALKQRGKQAMTVDQDRASHRFDALPDGGRIELQSDTDDPQAIAGIREHFTAIETAFRAGDFAIPMFVHDGVVPGSAVMAANRDDIAFIRRALPRGAELRLRTAVPKALTAIHDFMAFQRQEHRAPGRQ